MPGNTVYSQSHQSEIAFTPGLGLNMVGNESGTAIVVASLSLYGYSPPGDSFNAPWEVDVHLTDDASGQTATLAFTGTLTGPCDPFTTDIQNAFDAPLSREAELGGVTYTVALRYFVPPTPYSSGQITADVTSVAAGPPPATLAVSREATLYVPPNAVSTLAVSREATVYTPPNAVSTLAVSREAMLYVPPGAVATLAVSREGTLFRNYTLANAALALRIAAGLHTATPREHEVLNFGTPGDGVDIVDAVQVAYRATHPGLTP
jgi:hypothetical protein